MATSSANLDAGQDPPAADADANQDISQESSETRSTEEEDEHLRKVQLEQLARAAQVHLFVYTSFVSVIIDNHNCQHHFLCWNNYHSGADAVSFRHWTGAYLLLLSSCDCQDIGVGGASTEEKTKRTRQPRSCEIPVQDKCGA